jgi:plastocyanin domain-containing protein
MNANVLISIIVSISLIGGTLYVVAGGPLLSNESVQTQNIEIKDGVQYVTISAKGGYSPRVTDIKGGIPTKLIMETDGTYDCSSSLVIHAVGYQKMLPATGKEIIDLGIPKSGEELEGLCSMGMYSFLLKVS